LAATAPATRTTGALGERSIGYQQHGEEYAGSASEKASFHASLS